MILYAVWVVCFLYLCKLIVVTFRKDYLAAFVFGIFPLIMLVVLTLGVKLDG